MLTVLLGRTRFVGWETLVAIAGQSFLSVRTDPLRISLVTPPGYPGGAALRVVDNALERASDPLGRTAEVVATERSVGVFLGDFQLIGATLREAEVVHLRLDFRPIGLVLFDDVLGLHLGPSLMSDVTMQGSGTAIVLGVPPPADHSG